jgi:HEAT repeat protein
LVRALALAFCLAPLAAAQDTGKEVARWAGLLGDEDAAVRREARRRLTALGERIVPLLEGRSSSDTDVRRSLRSLLRRYQSLRLEVAGPTGTGRVGAQVVLRVSLVNNTEETYVIPLVQGAPTRSSFVIDREGGKQMRLSPDQVELLSPQGRMLILPPDQALRVKITLDGHTSPLRAPGRQSFRVVYRGNGVSKALLTGRKTITELSAIEGEVTVESRSVTIEVVGRTPGQLSMDLQSRDKRRISSALRELRLRTDAAVLDVIKRNLSHPRLREHGVRRLAAAARKQDFELLRAIASRESEDRNVRLVAIEGLGRYSNRRARSRLISLAQDERFVLAAVKALRKHKSAPTIDCYLRLMQRNYRAGGWFPFVRETLLEWTGVLVENRKSEIRAFERYWRRERAAWITRNRRK